MGAKHVSATRATGSAVAGASCGTGILGLSALIPDQYHFLRSAIMYASPTASIVIGVAWAWGMNMLTAQFRRWQIDRTLAYARKIRDAVLNNPNSSPTHRQNMQENVESLEQVAMEICDDETQSVRATLAGGTTNPTDPSLR